MNNLKQSELHRWYRRCKILSNKGKSYQKMYMNYLSIGGMRSINMKFSKKKVVLSGNDDTDEKSKKCSIKHFFTPWNVLKFTHRSWIVSQPCVLQKQDPWNAVRTWLAVWSAMETNQFDIKCHANLSISWHFPDSKVIIDCGTRSIKWILLTQERRKTSKNAQTTLVLIQRAMCHFWQDLLFVTGSR